MKRFIGNFCFFFRNLFTPKQIFFFTDCGDSNAASRVLAHLGVQVPFFKCFLFPLSNFSWQEGAMNLASVIEVWLETGAKGNVAVGNIAPRHDKFWKNGSPFCFAFIFGNLVVATPACFSVLVKKGLIKPEQIFKTDVFDVCSKFLPIEKAKKISETQFRSLWYVPYLLRWLLLGKNVPFSTINTTLFSFLRDLKWVAFFCDNFGNVKFLETYFDFSDAVENKSHFRIKGQNETYPIRFFERLSAVPVDGAPAFIAGSCDDQVELIIQGENASKVLNLGVGCEIEFLDF